MTSYIIPEASDCTGCLCLAMTTSQCENRTLQLTNERRVRLSKLCITFPLSYFSPTKIFRDALIEFFVFFWSGFVCLFAWSRRIRDGLRRSVCFLDLCERLAAWYGLRGMVFKVDSFFFGIDEFWRMSYLCWTLIWRMLCIEFYSGDFMHVLWLFAF